MGTKTAWGDLRVRFNGNFETSHHLVQQKSYYTDRQVFKQQFSGWGGGGEGDGGRGALLKRYPKYLIWLSNSVFSF